jgi:branched-chain amino acid transport system permease protein
MIEQTKRHLILLLPPFAALIAYSIILIVAGNHIGEMLAYPLHFLIMINIYVLLGLSINIITGYVGIVSLGQGAFYGVSAYLTVFYLAVLKLPIELAVILAIISNIAVSFFVSLPSIRLKRDYIFLAIIGFQVAIFSILNNWVSVTRGPYGISIAPTSKRFLIWKMDSKWNYAVASIVLVVLAYFYFYNMNKSSFGRVLKAIRDDDLVMEASGCNINKTKIFAFATSAGLAALAGSFFAAYSSYLDPTMFGLDESIFILALLFIGGAGNLTGVFWGAVFVQAVPEILRYLKLTDSVAANLRQIVLGLIIIILVRIKPTGISGDYDYD